MDWEISISSVLPATALVMHVNLPHTFVSFKSSFQTFLLIIQKLLPYFPFT